MKGARVMTDSLPTAPAAAPAAPPPDPTAGGRYLRRADGSLELVAQTQPATGRTPRDVAPVTSPSLTEE